MNIIQIGANNGRDHVLEFATQNKDKINKIILVEPVPLLENVLKETYKNFSQATIEIAGIVYDKTENTMPFYYLPGGNFEVSTFDINHLITHGAPKNEILTIHVPVMTFDELMKKHNLTELDNLFIDAEGMDCKILKSIDLKKYKINMIQFESEHSDGTRNRGRNFESVSQYLINNNYEIRHSGFDHIATLKR